MKKIKITALVMSLIMMITFTPFSLMQVMAEGIKEIDLTIDLEDANISKPLIVDAVDEDNYIEKEFVDKRTETSKQFLMSDGTIMVQKYGVPIHYDDGDGYKEIDNTLVLKTGNSAGEYYENTANSFKVMLSRNLNTENSISVENEGYTLSFTLNNRKDEQAQTAAADLIKSSAQSSEFSKAAKIDNTDAIDYSNRKLKIPIQPNVGDSILKYQNVFNEVDFEYTVNSLGVKEDIIINEPIEDYRFSYTINAPDMYLELSESGEIVAYAEDGNAVFAIPAPNMTDADGVYSEDVYYTLANNHDDTYTLGIIPDVNWMESAERSYPIRIDPAVYSIEKETANGLTLYYSGGSREYNGSRIKFGKVNSLTCDSFMSFPNENDQFYLSGYQLAYSKLRYYIRSVGGNAAGETKYYVRTAKSNVPLSAVTAFNQINYSSSPILLENTIKSTKFLFFNASHESRWEEVFFNPESFNGCADMVFMWYYSSTNDNQHGEVDVRSGNLPSVLNYYVSTVGIKEDLPYEQFSYNGGTASVNLINGAVTASFTALSIDTPTNPISLELVYNDYYDEIMDEFSMYNMFGNNIKINFQQAKLADTRAVRYIDADGSIDTLCQAIGTGNPAYYSVDRTMSFNSSDNAMYFNNNNTKLLFDGNKSYKIYDTSFFLNQKEMYQIFYSGNKITQIAGYTNGVKTHYISFTYSGDFVSYAQSYIASDVNGTSFQSLARCNFTYDADGNLIQIKNYNSGNVKYNLTYLDGQLYGLTDFDGNGYQLGRAHWTSTSPMRMSIINYIYGNSPDYGDHYSNDYVYFNGDETTSTVTYYATGGKNLGKRMVSRRFIKGTQSEWIEDEDGEISITATSSAMTGDTAQENLKYTQNIYSTTEKQNTTLSGSSMRSVSPGGSLSGSISSNHGIKSKTGRQYALSLMIESSGSTFVEVLVGGVSKGKLSLNGRTESYFVIPVNYYSGSSTTSIQIKNTGNNYVYISHVSYNYYTSVKTVKQIETMSINNYYSNIEVRTKDYKQTVSYNSLGQITGSSESDYTGTTTVTKNYTYTYENIPHTGTVSEYDVQRLKSVTDGEKTLTYEYSSSGALNNKSVATVKKGSTVVSTNISETNGALGNYSVTQTEEGIATKIDYAIKSGNVRPYKITSGTSVVEYTYNYDGEITQIKTGALSQQIGYSGGKEVSYTIGGSESYTVTRDSAQFGLVTNVKHNGSQRLAIDYTEYGDVESMSYANGATINCVYDYRDLQSIELRDSASETPTIIEYGYTNGDLTSVTQSFDGVTQLSYQFSDSKTQYITTISGALNAGYTYNYDDETGMLTSRVINLENGARTRTENFVYDNHGFLKENGNSSFKTQYAYDAYDRLSTKKQVIGSAVKQNIQYGYANTSSFQSDRISSVYNSTTGYTQTYGYDSNGYVSRYTNGQNGDNYTYSYDSAGRLLSDGIYTYTYDAFNNITKKTGGGKTYEYTYWSGKTRIKSVIENGSASPSFTYDSLGNIIYYKSATQNLYWTRGNMLESGNVKSNKPFTYKYGADNLRYSKTVNGTETLYYWDEDILMGEKTGGNYTQYIYDMSGIAGMIYNGAYYYFEKNLFGDVLNAYNSGGAVVASFRYDSYGNIISATGSMADKVNFRYRGYYYDDETGFYYLQSRYYDPSICRFISADNLGLVSTLAQMPGQLNLYAYCNNNPIMYADPIGEFPLLAIILGGLATIGLGLTIGGVASSNSAITAVGLTMVAIPSLIAGIMAIVAGIGGATLTGIVGGVTAVAGVGSGLFASAAYQETFTGNNWMLAAGMSRGWYNGLIITTATIATLGTFSSMFCYNFKIASINKIGKLVPSNHPNEGYWGIRFRNARGALQSLELQNHAPHGIHFQLNAWNPMHMSVRTVRRWTWYLR